VAVTVVVTIKTVYVTLVFGSLRPYTQIHVSHVEVVPTGNRGEVSSLRGRMYVQRRYQRSNSRSSA